MSDKLEINILLALERCGRLPLTLQLVLHGEHAFIFMGEEMDLLLLQKLTHISEPFKFGWVFLQSQCDSKKTSLRNPYGEVFYDYHGFGTMW